MINPIKYNIDFYMDKFKKSEFFSFTRWGDGEWFCTIGRNGKNCDGHIYFPEMSKGLQLALKEDKGYYKATWPSTHGQIQRNLKIITDYLKENNINIDWVNASVWEDLVLKEGIDKLVSQLENMNFIIVSEKSKRKLPIKYVDFVEVPKINCFLAKEEIKKTLKNKITEYEKPVFGFSASMATNVIIDELYPEIGDMCWMIDFGSIWDPFVGNYTRSYHKQYIKNKLK